MSNDHYVPQFLLKNFACKENEKKVWVFDKQSKKSYCTNTLNICAERDYNTSEVESSLSHIEGTSHRIIKSIIEKEQIKHLVEQDRSTLQKFIAIQILRTNNFRCMTKDLGEKLKVHLAQKFGIKSIQGIATEEEDVKNFSLDFLEEASHFASYLADKDWSLFVNTFEAPLYCSDNPVVMHNANDFGPRGNIGFNVTGIQFYFPLSPKFLLEISCPTNNEKYRESLRLMENQMAMIKMSPKGHLLKEKQQLLLEEIKRVSDGLENRSQGLPVMFKFETHQFFNSLQVRNAERFVVSNTNDFSLAQAYLKDFPHAKRGPRVEVV